MDQPTSADTGKQERYVRLVEAAGIDGRTQLSDGALRALTRLSAVKGGDHEDLLELLGALAARTTALDQAGRRGLDYRRGRRIGSASDPPPS